MTARKPALQIVREGNPGNHPAARLDGGLRLPVEAPTEPDWRDWFPTATGSKLRNTVHARARAEARRLWRTIVEQLHTSGLVTQLDRTLLADACITWAQLDMALRRIARDGMLVEGARGNLVRHPLLTPANQLRAHLMVAGREYGLSVLSRDRLPGGSADDTDDPFD